MEALIRIWWVLKLDGTQSCTWKSDEEVHGSKYSWKYQSGDRMESATDFLQLFSDKSQVSLIAGYLVFQSLHITLLISTKWRTELAMIKKTVRSYLPVWFHLKFNDEVERIRQKCKAKRGVSKNTLLESHYSMHFTRVLSSFCRKPLTRHSNIRVSNSWR